MTERRISDWCGRIVRTTLRDHDRPRKERAWYVDASRTRSLFEVLLPDSDKLWPDWLKRIDTLLEDEAVIETVASALEERWPKSRTRGRAGTPAEVVLRMLILKHLHDWSFDELEQEVRANLVYRAFTRIGVDAVPDAKTILKIAKALGPEVITDLHQRVVDVAKRAGVTHGRRFRIDTTVVETNVHYPTDSTLLQDGVRVLTRAMQRARVAGGSSAGRVRNRLRRVSRLGLAISLQARTPKTRDAMIQSYRRLMATTRAVLRDAATMIRRTGQQLRTATGASAQILRDARQQVQPMRPLVAARPRANAGAPVRRRHARARTKCSASSSPTPKPFARARSPSPRSSASWSRFKKPSIRSSRPSRSTPNGRRMSPSGRRHWIAIDRSLLVRRTSPPATKASRRRRMNGPPRTAACDAWCCRPAGGKPRRARRTNANAGSGAVSAGAPAVKDASVY